MKTITLSVDDQIASLLSQLSQREIDAVMAMVQIILKDKRSLKEVIRDAQEQARRNGLTQEKLDDILKELE